MLKGGRSADLSSLSSALFPFKPRQVLLDELLQKRNTAGPVQMGKNQLESLKPEHEPILTYSVALWLENKGYSKVLERFLTAAKIKDEDWKEKALNLNDIFFKYLEICEQKSEAPKEANVDEFIVDQSTKTKKNKNKKKSKLASEPVEAIVNQKVDVTPEVIEEKHQNDSEVIVELKDKKKKKKVKKDNLVADDKDSILESKNKVVDVDGANESKKSSKKRKRMDADENENQPGQEVVDEESKPKKTKGLEGGKDVQQPAANGAQPENSHINGVDNFSNSKSARKQHKASSEPKTVNAFQRVKIDEVKFADDRLQDNSYWAKAGAENGYGAKAQEILGQVKGRGFRHEKTKKKRGSYRGGQIDLQSHSIKFDNSDDE